MRRKIPKSYRDFYNAFYDQMYPKKKRRSFTKKTKEVVLLYQNFRCKACFQPLEFPEFHHIDGDRSNNFWGNCEALCPNCHARKTHTNRINSYWNF